MNQPFFRENRLIKLLSTLCLLMLINTFTFAQLENHTWYFGPNSTGIQFGPTNNQPSQHNVRPLQPFGSEGSAIVNDPETGEVLFYTNGEEIYDANDNEFTDQFGNNILLNGDPQSAQTVQFCQVPDNCFQYYAFIKGSFMRVLTSQQTETYMPTPLTVRVLDFSTGNLDISTLDILKDSNGDEINVGEASCIIPNHNSTDFWFVMHNLDANEKSDEVLVYSVTSNSVMLHQTFSINTLNTNTIGNSKNDWSYNMTYNDNANHIAMTFRDGNIALMDFNNSTGNITNLEVIDLITNAPVMDNSLYDCEFSPDGAQLYFSTTSSNVNSIAGLFQISSPWSQGNYNIKSLFGNPIINITSTSSSGGIKLGPDGALFFIGTVNNNGNNMIRISNPNAIHAANSFPQLNWSTGTLIGSRNFPETMPRGYVCGGCDDLKLKAKFTRSPRGNHGVMNFTPQNSGSNIDFATWDFDDGTTMQTLPGQTTYHQYNEPGTYTVCMTVTSLVFSDDDSDGNDCCTSEPFCNTFTLTEEHIDPCFYLNPAFDSYQFDNTAVFVKVGFEFMDFAVWDFGDGETAVMTSPARTIAHTYHNTGTYEVCVKAVKNNLMTGECCVEQACSTVVINSTPHPYQLRAINKSNAEIYSNIVENLERQASDKTIKNILELEEDTYSIMSTKWTYKPSLVKDFIEVTHSFEGNVELYVINFNGQIIKGYSNTEQSLQIPTSELTPGMYFLKIRSNEGEDTKKFIKVR